MRWRWKEVNKTWKVYLWRTSYQDDERHRDKISFWFSIKQMVWYNRGILRSDYILCPTSRMMWRIVICILERYIIFEKEASLNGQDVVRTKVELFPKVWKFAQNLPSFEVLDDVLYFKYISASFFGSELRPFRSILC